MKKNLLAILVVSVTLLVCLSSYAADTFTLDPQHPYILWHIKHFGFSTQAGKWYANGTLILDKEKPQNSKVNATINVADVITGIPELDKHLKGKLFLNVEQFPKATFVSDKVDVLGKDKAIVHGTLTLHGVSKPITLNVKLNQVGTSPITNKMTAGFTASTTLKRSDYGINTLLPGLSDDVTIDVEAEAFQSQPN